MPDLSASPEDYADHDAYAHAQAIMAKHAIADPDFDWAIGGSEQTETFTEYGIEPSPGTNAYGRTDDMYDVVEALPDYAAGARLVTREVTVGPWRYVTPEEIERWAAEE